MELNAELSLLVKNVIRGSGRWKAETECGAKAPVRDVIRGSGRWKAETEGGAKAPVRDVIYAKENEKAELSLLVGNVI